MDRFIEQAEVSKDVFSQVIANQEYNATIVKYYNKFAREGASIAFHSDLIRRKVKRLKACNSYWYNDYYADHCIKDFNKTVLCRDKFCSNCKKVKQAGRMAKYIPFIEPYSEHLFHVTLTVPNCQGIELRATCKRMAASFRKLIKLLRCDTRLSYLLGLNFGYKGAIRSLEVTFSNKLYHPHYHVAFVFNDLLLDDCDRSIVNNFSYSYGKLTRLFHEKEVLIQKVWYLLYNNLPVSQSSIDSLELGYSCTIQSFVETDYAELFKYMTKETKEDGKVLTYENFIQLYFGLHLIKQIQGYGCFYMVTDDDDLDSLNQIYDEEISSLRKIEMPQASYDTPRAMLDDRDNLYISRKNYFKYLNEILQEDIKNK